MTSNNQMTDIEKRATQIKLLAMDVDGVLTNGDIIYTDDGKELKIFNVKDGHGISMLRHHTPIEVALITGRNSPITKRRADELGIHHVFQGVKSKRPVLDSLMSQLRITSNQVAYIGDDTPDISVLKIVGLAICPMDAVVQVKEVCHLITTAEGGKGAVREITDLLMKCQPPLHWDEETRGTVLNF